MFNKSNKQILHILHDLTLLLILCVIGKRKKHITPVFEIMASEKNILFFLKHEFLNNAFVYKYGPTKYENST